MARLDGSDDVDRSLRLAGELLAAEGHTYAVAILGGAALNLLGIVERTTSDVDILAFADVLDRVMSHARQDFGLA